MNLREDKGTRTRRTTKPANKANVPQKKTTKKSKNVEPTTSTAENLLAVTNKQKVPENKGKRCTMEEYRSAVMKDKKKELHFEIDCSEMSEDNTIDVDECVSARRG